MGAEVASRSHGLPLAQAKVSSMKDEDNVGILTSTAAHFEAREDESTKDTDFNFDESRKSYDMDEIDCTKDNYDTISKHVEVKQQEKRPTMTPRLFSLLNGPSIEKNITTFILLPVMAITLYTYFGTSLIETQGQLNVKSIISSLLTSSSQPFDRYMVAIEKFPLLTKSLTTAIIQFLGDFAAQQYEKYRETGATKIHSNKVYDLRRGVSLFADGLLLSGPLMHYCFEWMEKTWPTSEEEDGVGLARPLATLCQVFFNDYIIDSTYIALSFVFTGIFEGYSLKEVVTIIRKDFWATIRASWLTSFGLIPIEMLCFGYLSLSFRVLAMNFVDLLWGAIVSFYSHRSRTVEPKERYE